MILRREGLGFFFRLLLHAQYDEIRGRLGLSAHTIPIVGRPVDFAVITAPGAIDGYTRLTGWSFTNEACARSILTALGFNPIDHARHVQCPVLIQICEEDNLAPMSSALKAASILGDLAEVKRYPIGHFDIYSGEHFERSVSDQIEFLKKHLW
jgi:pimeloyl-ACP methyl ester carboxylesterase